MTVLIRDDEMKKKKQNLESLIQKAASELVVMDPLNQGQADNVASIFDDLAKGIGDISLLPDEIKDKALKAAQFAKDKLTSLPGEQDAFKQLISDVADTVDSLQSLIDHVTRGMDLSDIIIDIPLPQSESAQNPDSKIMSNAAAEEKAAVSDVQPQSQESQPEQAVQTESSSELLVISEDDAPLVMDFAVEALEHIETAESALLELESNCEDKEAINSIFRSFHTVKGMAGFLNLTEIGSLAHSAESLLDMARNGSILLVDQKMDLVFESLDMLKNMITVLKAALESSSAVPSQPGHQALIVRLKASIDPANSADQAVEKGVSVQSVEAAKPSEESSSSCTAACAKAETITADAGTNNEHDNAQASAAGQNRKVAVASDEKIKVSMDRLDKLVNMVGELVIAQSMVRQDSIIALSPEHDLCQKISHQGKIIRELQELSMMMRMVPIQGVFQKMARLVRDLSHKVSKQIRFETFGEETELDRIVVDQIADPLIHMIRNSVDHGIESEQERIAAGKDAIGTVQLRAFHQAGNIIIEIVDDGKGLDKDRILRKAIEKGIVSPNADISDAEIYKLIFNAGFSTAEKITDVSGRGVGMDVVKQNIDALRGKIDIASEKGKGTTFTIRLPLTLAIIDGQLVRLGDETYIIPINSIDSCLKPRKEQISTIRERVEMANVHGELLPIVRLHKLFNAKADAVEPSAASLVVVEEDGKRGCLMVDEALGQQQVVIKSLGDYLGKIKGVAGGAILGDGKVALIIDVQGILNSAW